MGFVRGDDRTAMGKTKVLFLQKSARISLEELRASVYQIYACDARNLPTQTKHKTFSKDPFKNVLILKSLYLIFCCSIVLNFQSHMLLNEFIDVDLALPNPQCEPRHRSHKNQRRDQGLHIRPNAPQSFIAGSTADQAGLVKPNAKRR